MTRPSIFLLSLALLIAPNFAPTSRAELRLASGFDSNGQFNPASGMVLVDVDRDGKLDIVESDGTDTASPHTMSVRRGLGDGSFATPVPYATAAFPMDIAAGDLNGDGWPDVAVACRGQSMLSVLLNRGDGTFFPRTSYAVGSAPRSVAIGDMNGDGHADLVSGNATAGTVSILLGAGDGTFAAAQSFASGPGARSARLADWDGDGNLDVVVALTGANGIAIQLGNGDGTLQEPQVFAQPAAPVTIDLRDVNGDTRPDLAVAWNATVVVSVFLQAPDGTLAPRTDYPTTGIGMRAAFGDVTGDGVADLIATDWKSSPACDLVSVFAGLGNGAYAAETVLSTGGRPDAIAFGDVDQSGRTDIVVACVGSSTIASHLANLDGTFGTKRDLTAHGSVGNVTLADWNGDGHLDILAPGNATFAVWPGTGNRTFGAPLSYGIPNAPSGKLYVADVDGDGFPDAITFSGSTIDYVRGDGHGGNLGSRTIALGQFGIGGVAPVDLDGDGWLDFVAAMDWSDGNTYFAHQTPGGGFAISSTTFHWTDGSAEPVYDVETGDANGDGLPDLFLSTDHGLVLRLATGPFQYAAPVYQPGTVSRRKAWIGDLNGDGKIDYAICTISKTVAVGLGNGDGTFTPMSGLAIAGSGTWVDVADFDRDGIPDLFAAIGTPAVAGPNCVSVMRGLGNGTFAAHVDLGVNLAPGNAVADDLDGDGWPEIVANGQTITVLDNLMAQVVAVPPSDVSPRAAHLLLATPMPNPGHGNVTLAITLPTPGDVTIRIVDVAGRRVSEQRHDGLLSGRQTLRLDVAGLRTGLYFVRASDGKETATTRMVVAD